jgi:hypothetical protein
MMSGDVDDYKRTRWGRTHWIWLQSVFDGENNEPTACNLNSRVWIFRFMCRLLFQVYCRIRLSTNFRLGVLALTLSEAVAQKMGTVFR